MLRQAWAFGCKAIFSEPKVEVISGTSGASGRLQSSLLQGVELRDICRAYTEERLRKDEWEGVGTALQRVPISPEKDPKRLSTLLVNFPEHGQVILKGARNAKELYGMFGDACAQYKGIVEKLAKLDSNAWSTDWQLNLDADECKKVFQELTGFYTQADPQIFEAFVWDVSAETRAEAYYCKLMSGLAYYGSDGVMCRLFDLSRRAIAFPIFDPNSQKISQKLIRH